MTIHERYIKRCIELAKLGLGKVAPNPMVGSVLVYKNKIIGEGYHHQFGAAHAEVNAINSVKNKRLLKDAVLYVNLEPCSHVGKTHPCADLIIAKGIKYIVVGTVDPNPLVAGKGLQKLISAGCDVKLGVLENECIELNKRFFIFHKKKRPYIVLKWAHTADEYIGIKTKAIKMGYAKDKGIRLQISGKESLEMVHQWRSEEQAIMVGTNTALVDNPKLTVRKVKGKNPTRIFVDRQLKVPLASHLLDGTVPTIVFTSKHRYGGNNIEYIVINFKKDVLKQIMMELFKRNIQSILVEGGAKLLSSFIRENLWDEARVFSSQHSLNEITKNKKNGIAAPKIAGKVIGYQHPEGDQLLVLSNIS